MKIKLLLITAFLSLAVGCQSTTNSALNEPSETTSPLPQDNNSPSDILAALEAEQSKQQSPLEPIEPAELNDVWQRIKHQLSFPDSDHPRVTARIDWYLKHPNYMDTITQRASPLLHYIVLEVEKRGLPIELALMPLIESDFDTSAYSHKHASGLWQLTPLIAKHYGIKINPWYDGRQDIVDSTRAALDFLTDLHKKFDGNWYYAIAAYNTGEGRVFRAIERNKKQGKPTDFFSLSLPKQTRHYVPKLLAASHILKHQKLAFPSIDNQSVISVLKLDNPAILNNPEKWQEIESLNPGYARFPALLGGPEHVVVPTQRVTEWDAMLAALPNIPTRQWQEYTIVSGDSLSVIAAKFSLKVSELKSFNNLKSDRIRAGKKLLLPILAEQKLDYTIKRGDSLWTIAKRFNVSIAKLKQWNQLSSNRIKIGDTLNLFL